MLLSPRTDIGAILVPLAGALAAIALVAVPVAMLLYAAFHGPSDYLPFEPGAHWTLDNLRQIYADPVLVTRILPDTLKFVIGTVTATTLIAFVLAWLVERTDLAGRDVWFALILFPLIVPTPVLAIAWIFLMGPNAGWINLALRAGLGISGPGPVNVFSMSGLIVCQALATTPFVFLLFSATLRSMNPAYEEASAMVGASSMTTLRRITLPVLLPGLLAPVILATLITFEQFELPLMVGLPARINVFSYRIYTELNPSSGLPNYAGAAAISIPFLLIGLCALVLYNWTIRKSDGFVVVTGRSFRQRRHELGRWRWGAIAFVASYVALATAIPAATLAWTSLFGYAPPTPAGMARFSLEAYRALIGNPTFWHAVANTLTVATLTALITVAVGGLIGWIVARSKMHGRRALDILSFMSTGLPSVIVALSIMILYLSFPIGIYGTIWILVIALSYRIAATTRIARAGVMQIHPELEEASAVSGAQWLATQLRIVVPLLSPALLSGFILLFVITMREFTIPLVLYSQDNVVLPVMLWQLYQGGQPAPSAALATFIVAMVLPLVFLARRFLVQRI